MKHKYHAFPFFGARQEHRLGNRLCEFTVGIEKINVIERLQFLLTPQKNFKTLERRIRPWLRFLVDTVDPGIFLLPFQVVGVCKDKIVDLTLL